MKATDVEIIKELIKAKFTEEEKACIFSKMQEIHQYKENGGGFPHRGEPRDLHPAQSLFL